MPQTARDDDDESSRTALGTSTPLKSSTAAALSNPPAYLAQSEFFSNSQKIWMKRYRTEVAASTASLCSTLTAYPLDSVKTRMQAYRFNNFFDCVRHTYATEGMGGFWRGVLAPLTSITAVRTISFSAYQKSKYLYDAWIERNFGTSPLEHANRLGAHPNLATLVCFGAAGATSGGAITVLSCPFELTKLAAQIHVLMQQGGGASGPGEVNRSASSGPMPRPPGTIATARRILRQRGLPGLYSGFNLHLMRDVLGTSIYFMTYESTKQLMANARGRSPTSPVPVVLAGGLCGLVSWACIYPIDSAKTIYQRGFLTCEKGQAPPKVQIRWFERRMYRGLGVSMGRSAAINAIFFSVFEMVKKHVNKLEVER